MNVYESDKLNGLSYSSLQSISSCPTKWMLRKLSAGPKRDTIHTVFGKVFGEGVQAVVAGEPFDKVVWKMLNLWPEIFELTYVGKADKGFYQAVHGVELFKNLWELELSHEYELVHFGERPAVELGIKITLNNGQYYVMYIDLVLRNKFTNELIVLELKTTGSKFIDEASYRNSLQALGYGVALDKIAQLEGQSSSSYTVLYLVYQTGSKQFNRFNFTKSYKSRAEFLQTIVVTSNVVSYYKTVEFFPKSGDGCVTFNQRCEFYELCDSHPERLIDQTKLDEKEPERHIDFVFDIQDLIDSQKEIAES